MACLLFTGEKPCVLSVLICDWHAATQHVGDCVANMLLNMAMLCRLVLEDQNKSSPRGFFKKLFRKAKAAVSFCLRVVRSLPVAF